MIEAVVFVVVLSGLITVLPVVFVVVLSGLITVLIINIICGVNHDD